MAQYSHPSCDVYNVCYADVSEKYPEAPDLWRNYVHGHTSVTTCRLLPFKSVDEVNHWLISAGYLLNVHVHVYKYMFHFFFAHHPFSPSLLLYLPPPLHTIFCNSASVIFCPIQFFFPPPPPSPPPPNPLLLPPSPPIPLFLLLLTPPTVYKSPAYELKCFDLVMDRLTSIGYPQV